MLRPRVNQRLIAKQLKLSPATVSKSFRHHPDIKPETRQRVLSHAAKLGYQIDPSGRGSRHAQGPMTSRLIGVLIHDNHGANFADYPGQGYVTGLSEAAARFDVSLIVHRFGGDSHQILDPNHQPPAMRQGALDGLVLVHRYDADVVKALSERVPCVTLTFYVPGSRCDHVDSNHAGAMADVVKHLHDLGHRRFGYLGHPNRPSNSLARFAGFARALATMGLPLELGNVSNVYENVLDWDGQADFVQRRLKQGVTAWVGSVDTVGNHLCRRLIARGVRVPEDVSVTGYDCDEPLYGLPRLTSVRVPFVEMGAYALSRLLERLEEPSLPRTQTMLDCELVVGQSTGTART